MEKCECYIRSLKQGETHVLGEATIIRSLGDNDYLAEYNGVKCHAIFNPFAGRYFVDGRDVQSRNRPHERVLCRGTENEQHDRRVCQRYGSRQGVQSRRRQLPEL